MSLILDDYLKRNPDSLVTVTHDRLGIKLAGLLSDAQLVQSLSAGYGNSILENIGTASTALSSFGQGMPGKKGAFARVAGAGLSAAHSYATSQHTLIGTVQTYEGSGEINIPVNMTIFFNWAGNPSLKEVDNWINLLTQPKVYIGGLLGSNLYEPTDLAKLALLNTNLFKGKLINIRLGNWMLATDVYVTSVSKNFLTNTDEDGKPIALQLSFQIKPYRQLSAEELTAWLI